MLGIKKKKPTKGNKKNKEENRGIARLTVFENKKNTEFYKFEISTTSNINEAIIGTKLAMDEIYFDYIINRTLGRKLANLGDGDIEESIKNIKKDIKQKNSKFNNLDYIG